MRSPLVPSRDSDVFAGEGPRPESYRGAASVWRDPSNTFAILKRQSRNPKPMPTISVRRRHKLDHKKARAAAQKIAEDLNKRFDLVCRWKGDDVSFERPGLSGNMRV